MNQFCGRFFRAIFTAVHFKWTSVEKSLFRQLNATPNQQSFRRFCAWKKSLIMKTKADKYLHVINFNSGSNHYQLRPFPFSIQFQRSETGFPKSTEVDVELISRLARQRPLMTLLSVSRWNCPITLIGNNRPLLGMARFPIRPSSGRMMNGK